MEDTMTREKKRIKTWMMWAAIFLVIAVIIAAVQIHKWVEANRLEDDRAERYMEDAAWYAEKYAMGFDKLPADIEAWREWNSGMGEWASGVLFDPKELSGGMKVMGGYNALVSINVASPGNSQCRELFEALGPYFEQAFIWEPGTTAKQCRERLSELIESEELQRLCDQVDALYEECQVDRWFVLATGGDLQMLPEEYDYVSSSGDLQAMPEEYMSSSGDLQMAPEEYVSSDSDLQVNP